MSHPAEANSDAISANAGSGAPDAAAAFRSPKINADAEAPLRQQIRVLFVVRAAESRTISEPALARPASGATVEVPAEANIEAEPAAPVDD